MPFICLFIFMIRSTAFLQQLLAIGPGALTQLPNAEDCDAYHIFTLPGSGGAYFVCLQINPPIIESLNSRILKPHHWWCSCHWLPDASMATITVVSVVPFAIIKFCREQKRFVLHSLH
jgi:hypothetical protein